MTSLPLDEVTVLRRMNGIQDELREMKLLAAIQFTEFKSGVGFKLAQYHLHRALEGVFHISSHILSRIPGGQPTEYKAMARKCGELGVVDRSFAEQRLVAMAGYRNRLVHFYAEISAPEIYDIITNHLTDFDTFLFGVKQVLQAPERFGIKPKDKS